MENFRAGAIMIFCGEAKGGEPEGLRASSAFSKLVQKLDGAPGVWRHGRDLITGTETLSQHYPIGDIHYGQPG